MAQENGHASGAEQAASHAGGAAHHTPPLVEFVNHWIGEPVHQFQIKYTQPLWDRFFAYFGTTAEDVFGRYTVENAVPWYTVMFILACILTIAVVWVLKGRLSEDEPESGQQVLEVGVLAIRNLLEDVVGPHGLKYFPIVATFGVLILISNLMSFIPGLMAPTASTSVTYALGITSFVYYNYIGIKENGLFGHLRHFAGPVLALAPLLFLIEMISNFIRPFSLGTRLFGNMFADEQVVTNIAQLYPPLTYFVAIILMPLGLFVAFIQSFIFTFLSMVYISEVSHAPHDEHEAEHGETRRDDETIVAPVPV